MIWDEMNQNGWKFELFDEDAPADGGYYTFRVGVPVYANVEPKNGGWLMSISTEENDDDISNTVYQELEAAKAAAGPAILALFDTWRTKVAAALTHNTLPAPSNEQARSTWKLGDDEHYAVYSQEGRPVALLPTMDDRRRYANARLIAAAPDLLAAIEALLPHLIDDYDECAFCHGEPYADDNGFKIYDHADNCPAPALMAAIAKTK